MHDRHEEGRGAKDNCGEARCGSRDVPQRIGLREYLMHGNKRSSNQPRRDQIEVRVPITGHSMAVRHQGLFQNHNIRNDLILR